MAYLVHTVHPQFVGLWLGGMGWILTIVTIGLIQWRVWEVADVSDISSGEAWVGIWRVCFYSHTLVSAERGVLFCQKMGISDSFVPMEIALAQVLMLVALVLGFLANASTIYGLRNVFFGLDKHRPIRVAFTTGGLLHLLSCLCSLLPLSLNLHAVTTNQSIGFPESFHMPPVPVRQHAGAAIGVGITAAVLSIVSGFLFLCYQFPRRTSAKVEPSWANAGRTEDGSTRRPLSSRSDDRSSALSPYGLHNATSSLRNTPSRSDDRSSALSPYGLHNATSSLRNTPSRSDDRSSALSPYGLHNATSSLRNTPSSVDPQRRIKGTE